MLARRDALRWVHRNKTLDLQCSVLNAVSLLSGQEGVLKATDLGDGKLANLVRYHCEQPPAGEQVRRVHATRVVRA